MPVWYVGEAPYFTQASANRAAKGTGLAVVRREICPACNGDGRREGKHCLSCLGTGEVDTKK